ncbi:sulfotransferase domain-containing protein [Caldalkalibacillus salinus]|uniref:sulfotransferase domain-containing protein n=1 Tax=Caldalkalibacillus salinus TaxID=2803787 RepID=UPI0019240405|nr:sulfotransferase domain-containing protein [Caldalkalibacillus salinus]
MSYVFPRPLKPFLVSSVPKSGTHLMHQLLNGIPQLSHPLQNQSMKFFVNNPPSQFYEDHDNRLKALQPNQFGLGHLHYTPEYVTLLRTHQLKHIFVYRDPRDVLVSLCYFIADKWKQHPLHQRFQALSIKDRALTLINGIPGEFPHFSDYFGPFYGWLKDTDTLKVSYEELMQTRSSRRQACRKMVHYLWENQTPPEPINLLVLKMERNVNTKKSVTFRKGQVGSWRDEFDDEVIEAFKRVANPMLQLADYEKNHHWS